MEGKWTLLNNRTRIAIERISLDLSWQPTVDQPGGQKFDPRSWNKPTNTKKNSQQVDPQEVILETYIYIIYMQYIDFNYKSMYSNWYSPSWIHPTWTEKSFWILSFWNQDTSRQHSHAVAYCSLDRSGVAVPPFLERKFSNPMGVSTTWLEFIMYYIYYIYITYIIEYYRYYILRNLKTSLLLRFLGIQEL